MNRPDDSPNNSIIIYTTEDGLTKIDTTFDGDTVWLSIDQMADLFQRDKSTISRHIKNIFAEGELDRDAVVAKFATTAADGKTYQVEFYNLDVIISVGYRVKSKRGTQFRIWATGILKEYMRKGFALDDERLKNLGGGGYFKELLERMRYNPFAYIHEEKDILKLVTTLMTNTKGEGQGGDPFWDKAERLLLTSLIAYLHYEAPAEEQNFATLLEMLNTMQVSEEDEDYQNPVDLLFEDLAKKKPNSFAGRQYKLYKLAAGDICSK